MLHEDQLVVTATQMRAAEQRAMLEGTAGYVLMQRAGAAVAQEIFRRFRPRKTLVLCGPGNNGGDGFVVAELLRAAGWPVEAACMLPTSSLQGDALLAAQAYKGELVPFSTDLIRPELLIVDALFGTGLERPLEGEARHMLATADALECAVVAIDIPSGIHSDSGKVLGTAAHAALTVTFAAQKPGHVLFPGREYAGEIVIADIGIASQIEHVALERRSEGALIHVNVPGLWQYSLRWPGAYSHKYTRGAVLVAGGPVSCTGAARLAARAALRVGAGASAIACNAAALPVYAAQLTAVMTQPCEDAEQFITLASDEKYRALLIGPGHGGGEKTATYVSAALATKKPCVLDADALSCFAGKEAELYAAMHPLTVMTPHEGEFTRLFGAMEGDKIARALNAAKHSKAVVVLKGADTVIASPDGRVAVNIIAPADLATAGSGDVLAGMISGLLATGMPVWEAAAAAVWMHSVAGERLGCGLIAEDIADALPEILKYLKGL